MEGNNQNQTSNFTTMFTSQKMIYQNDNVTTIYSQKITCCQQIGSLLPKDAFTKKGYQKIYAQLTPRP